MLLLIGIAIVLIAWYLHQAYSKFSKRGVKCLTPFPLLGDMAKMTLYLEHLADNTDRIYKAFPEERFVGNYEFVTPLVFIRDIELVKKITVKDFEYFLDHRINTDGMIDPISGRNLFSMKGQDWKDMRSTLSPVFTSSKMQVMFPFMMEAGENMIESLKTKMRASGRDYIDVEFKDVSSHYTNDVIASCAFGLKINTQIDQHNEFYEMGKDISRFDFIKSLKFIAFGCFPGIMKAFKITLFSKASTDFFRELVRITMKEREAKNIIRPDLIHLLMQVQKGQLNHDARDEANNASGEADAGFATVTESDVGKKKTTRVWSHDDLVAQAAVFFIAGFETVSVAMNFLVYELAVNPDIQERLAQEIKENDRKNDGKFNYTSIQQMTYLDMVVSELLRLWPPGAALDRVCIKDYNLGKPNDQATEDYIIRKGEGIKIPVWSFHRDPQYFPEPSKFDPDRFSEENKHKIKPFTYNPFGIGPRGCIGSRFALCEVKVMIYQLLQQMVISPCEKTPIPARLSPRSLDLNIEGGHWIRLKSRNW